MSKMIDCGAGLFVQADDIVAIHDGKPTDEELDRMAIVPFGATRGQRSPKSEILLRSGLTLPGYENAYYIVEQMD